MAASLLIGVPVLAGNMASEAGVSPGGAAPQGLHSDRHIGTDTKTAPSDADVAAILDIAGSAPYEIFSPATVGNATGSANSELFDIRDSALLGRVGGGLDLDPIEMLGPVSDGTLAVGTFGTTQIVESQGSIPILSQGHQDRPAVVRWIYSLLEAVGINERCSDPKGCGGRVATNK